GAAGRYGQLAGFAAVIEIDENARVDSVVIVQIVRRPLVKPARLPGIKIARENARGPFVVARTLVGIPRPGISGTVIDEVGGGIVSHPAPHRAAADFPRFRRPRFDPEIRAAVLLIKWMELIADQHIGIVAGTVGAPPDFALARVDCGDPAAHPPLSAAFADQDFVFHYQ